MLRDGETLDDFLKTQDDSLGKFYKPARYHPDEYIYNTQHGEVPEHHTQSDFEKTQTEPEGDDYTLVRKPWAAKGDTPPKPGLPENDNTGPEETTTTL